MDNATGTFEVTVVYATSTRQEIITVPIQAGCTALQAVELSGIGEIFPDIDYPHIRLGIFGRLVDTQHLLAAGDRVEIYRPLLMDPKESRRQRARAAKHNQTGKTS